MESTRYAAYAALKEREFEDICKRCGACCGAGNDPCDNLIKMRDGTYSCRDYAGRLGQQKTVSGKEFNCVPIRTHIAQGSLRAGCAYR